MIVLNVTLHVSMFAIQNAMASSCCLVPFNDQARGSGTLSHLEIKIKQKYSLALETKI